MASAAPLPDPSAGADAPNDRAGHGGGDPPRGSRLRVSNALIAVLMLVVAESMLFTGLIGAFLVLRVGLTVWPPANEPRLPLAMTWLNTGFLFLSAITMLRAVRSVRRDDAPGLVNALRVTAYLGVLFVAIQGTEWARLLAHGLTLASSTYGATFYTLIGLHGLHVLAAVVWVLVVLARARRGAYSRFRRDGVATAAVYWIFVCAVWAFLFPLVYLL